MKKYTVKSEAKGKIHNKVNGSIRIKFDGTTEHTQDQLRAYRKHFPELIDYKEEAPKKKPTPKKKTTPKKDSE